MDSKMTIKVKEDKKIEDLDVHGEDKKTMNKVFRKYKNGMDDIEIAQTKVTSQQLTKFFLHWLMLFGVHFMIFWYYPLKGNTSLYDTAICPEYHPYGCRDF